MGQAIDQEAPPDRSDSRLKNPLVETRGDRHAARDRA